MQSGADSGTGDGGYTATSGTDQKLYGVWLSDELLTPNEGANGDTVLRVTLDCTLDEIQQFECNEEGKDYREFLIPGAFIVTHGSVARVRKDSLGMRKIRRHAAILTRR